MNKVELLKEFERVLQENFYDRYITEADMNNELNYFKKWLEKAKVGDTYYYKLELYELTEI